MQKFSVSMCLYNGDNPIWFSQAIQSIKKQSIIPNEIVIVVDGPINNELETVLNKEINDLIKIVRLEKNCGHGIARRTSLENCTNELVAIMDADDIAVENRFELQLNIFNKNPNLDIVGGNICEFIDSIDNIVSKRIVPQNDKDIKIFLKQRCPMNQMTVMFKKSSINSVGGYLDWYNNEDYYLWIRMALNNKIFYNIQDNLVYARIDLKTFERRGGIKYFNSELKLFKFMYEKKIINFISFLKSVSIRFIVQILMPNNIRKKFFKTFARKK